MSIEIGDELIRQTQLSESDLKIEIAAMLYDKHKFTFGQARAFGGITQLQLQEELAKGGIHVHYSPADVEQDIKSVHDLGL